MPKSRSAYPLLVASIIGLTACGGGDEPSEEAAPAPAPAAAVSAPQEDALPEATADAVWAYLQEQEYDSWPMWPGRSALYPGGEPHGMLLTMYVNDVALEAARAGSLPFPAGSIVIKENYTPDSTLAAVTVMYKVEGFNPDHHDWWFLKRNADGSVDVEGRGAGCESCHGSVAESDYLFAASEGEGGA